jgi:SAM-dependent methyltransferase
MDGGIIMADWISYKELAWTEPILAPPESCSEEIENYCSLIKKHSQIEPVTLLHLACGAGSFDHTFKKHFKVTGVDLSVGMLNVARGINPEIEYLEGDMRSVNLGRLFDAVVIPESIGYMTTVDDLRKTISTAKDHLKPGGILLIVAHMKEEFQDNNFAYTGRANDINITVFENNYVLNPPGDMYEATIVYLIRRAGELKIYNDRHLLGLFTTNLWMELLSEQGLEVKRFSLNELYDSYILGEGEYPMTMFVCLKT